MQIEQYIAKNHQLNVKILSSLSTGFGVKGYKALLDQSELIAIKSNLNAPSPAFKTEAKMLETLSENGWPIPKIILADEHLLIIEWLESDNSAFSHQGEFETGQLLAQLHQKRRDHFGFETETPIGALPQSNPKTEKWVPFFRDHRLLAMAKIAHVNGLLPNEIWVRINYLAEKIENYIDEPTHPSLLHGDLWGGNVLTLNGHLQGVIDPAIYYGHPEIELAFTQMFNTFGTEFFNGYESISPLTQDFYNIRIDLYNLYPALVHLNLFGKSYLPPIHQTLTKLGL